MADIHGVNVREAPQVSAPAIPLPNISAGGLIGTAPDIHLGTLETPGKFTRLNPQTNELEIAYNEPFLITKRADAIELGSKGTLPQALDAIYSQHGNARIAFVPIEEYEDAAQFTDTVAYEGTVFGEDGAFRIGVLNEIIAGAQQTALTSASARASKFGLSQNAIVIKQAVSGGSIGEFPSDEQTLIRGLRKGQRVSIETGGSEVFTTELTDRAYLAGSGALLGYVILPIAAVPDTALTDGTTYTITVHSQVSADRLRQEATGNLGHRTGVYALLSAQSRHGVTPRIIAASGLDTGSRPENAANGLGAALEAVADELRGIAYVDGPSTTHEAALATAEDYGSDRVYLIDPRVKTSKDGATVVFATSAFAMGLTLKTDAEQGWWTLPSNKLFNNVLGTERDIDFVMGSANSRAQLLNDVGIATVVNIGGGYRLWGDYTQASGDRITWQFLNVRRIADALYDAIADNHLWAVDKNITPTYLTVVSDGVNKLMRDLQARGAILGGSCYPHPDKNTESQLALGVVSFVAEFTPSYPARTINFDLQLNTRRLAELV